MVISKQIKAGVIWAGVVDSYPNMLCCWHPPVAGVLTRTPDPNFRGGWRSWQRRYSIGRGGKTKVFTLAYAKLSRE